MRRSYLLLATLAILLIAGCGPQIYTNQNFTQYQQAHQLAAILPFDVTIDPNKLPKNLTMEDKAKAEKDEGYGFQRQLYMQFLQRQQKGEYTIEFQDVDKTNALLAKAGVTYDSLFYMTKGDLKKILEVDAIIGGTIYREKLMSTGGAIAMGVLFGAWGNTNKVNIGLTIHDATTDELVWKYDHETSGSVGSSPEKMAKSLMKNISKKFPYKRQG